MQSLIRLYPNVLDAVARDELMALAASPSLRRTVGDGGFDEWMVPPGSLAEALRHSQQAVARRYAADCQVQPLQWPTQFGYERLRLKRYKPGDQFPPHVDVVDHITARRFLAFLWYVEQPEAGGETDFLPGGPSVSPQTGACLVFPPMWPFLHVGRPAGSAKTILSGYLHYV